MTPRIYLNILYFFLSFVISFFIVYLMASFLNWDLTPLPDLSDGGRFVFLVFWVFGFIGAACLFPISDNPVVQVEKSK